MSNAKISAVHKAVMDKNLSNVAKAIESGEGVDSLDRDGRSALFYAVRDGNVAIVKELVKYGANVNLRDMGLETPLHFAARGYQQEVADFLLKSGAIADAQDVHGNTPLSRAVFDSRGRGDLIRLLISYGADKTLKNNRGVSPEGLANTIANYDIKSFLN